MPRKNSRTANNTGSIRQRADGRWEGRITLGVNPGTGKPVRKSIYGATQKEVRQKMQKILVEVDEGVYTQPSKLTVKQWLEIWIEDYTGDVKQSTVSRYKSDLDNHIIPALGAVKLSDLTSSMVQKLYNNLQKKKKPLSAKSVRNFHGVFHQALKQAVKLKYIRSNPTEDCTLPRVEKKEIKPLDAPEIKIFLASLGDDIYSTLYKVDMFTGLRHGEILGLTWDRVDFNRGIITVNRQLIRPRSGNREYQLATLKNDKTRVIRPASYVIDLLRERRKVQLQDRLRAGMMWDEGALPGLVFTTETGKHLSSRVVLRRLKKELKKAGLREMRMHDLRHTYAVTSLFAGDDVKTLQGNLGHATVSFTLDVYGHVMDAMREASAHRMEAFIAGLK